MRAYDHRKIEKKWQKEWEKKQLYKTAEKPARVGGKKKMYVLDMFPYPSGDGLHVGHPKGYIATDIVSRHARMNGKSVLHPMGWDAFGLPAENYAIKNKVHPRKAVEKNVKRFKEQLKLIGLDYDWSREINTTDPEFYKWTQWIFLKLYEKGLAYQSFEPINWCPSCQTGLANEDLEGNACERCGTVVEKRPMRQWTLKITDYAERLLNDLELLPEWQEHIKESQRNWIGKSEGAEIDFPLTIRDPKRIILLHGKGGSATGAFKPWLKEKLEKLGYEVESPQLPNSATPDDEEQADYVEKNYKLDAETVIVGHSFGGLVTLRLLERGAKVKRVVLLGTPFTGMFMDKKPRPTVTAAIKKGFDFERIKKNAQFIQLYDTHDHAIPISDGEAYNKALGGLFMRVQARTSHFNGTVEPDVFLATTPAIRVFTTRPDTLFGATYMVLSPEHPWVQLAMRDDHAGVLKNQNDVRAYVAKAGKKTEIERQENKEKTGVKLEGVEAINPATGEKIPLYVADYVLANYGTGAIMAVPAHDERDFEFAKKFNIAIKEVVSGGDVQNAPYIGPGTLVNSGEFDGMDMEEAKHAITEKFGTRKTTYKIRDWVFSRQRYWGEPIPIIHCEKCGVVPVPEKDLPVKLPDVKKYEPTGTGESPLAAIEKWVNVKCPKCKGKAKRETNTMPQWAGSSWYWLRYMDPKNKKALVDTKKEKYWAPVDLYVGGAEHATRHLIYGRFWHKFLQDIGVVSTPEPFTRLISVGLIQAEDGRKMSKRFGNVINPDDIIETYGADTLRVYEMFMGPFSDAIAWKTSSLIGARRFIERVWRLQEKFVQKADEAVERELHKTIKKVGEDIANFKFNTAISQMMIFVNAAEGKGITKKQYQTFVALLAPFAPHVAEELWHEHGGKGFVHVAAWPKFDAKKLATEEVTIVVQVNGKVRAQIQMPTDSSEEAVRLAAGAATTRWLENKEIRKFIYIQNKLASIVIDR